MGTYATVLKNTHNELIGRKMGLRAYKQVRLAACACQGMHACTHTVAKPLWMRNCAWRAKCCQRLTSGAYLNATAAVWQPAS